MEPNRRRVALGWIAVGVSTVIACIWAIWGVLENFHEGWYYPSLLDNLFLMLVQYLSPALGFIGLSLLALFHSRTGSIAHLGLAILLPFFFNRINLAALLIISPLLILSGLYWYGRPQPRQRAAWLVIGLPFAVILVFGAAPALRVASRVHDGDLGARLVEGNGARLIWAPEGDGWPRKGVNWHEAVQRCQYLTADGASLASVPQLIWRLPSVDEVVRSMARHGVNSGGVWDAERRVATYQIRPDKESPLWNGYSPVIYWWTATEIDAETAYIVVYDGQVWPREKAARLDYLGFRCVKAP